MLRDLTDHGLKVIVADTSKYNICSMSNRVEQSVVCADPFLQTPQFIQDICRIIEEFRPKVLLPAHEETLIIAKYRDQLPASVEIPIMDFGSLLKAHNKTIAAKIAENAGVPVPRIYHPQNVQDLEELKASFRYPMVLKLPKSNAAKGVYYAHSFENVKQLFSQYYDLQLKTEERLYLQDYIQGVGYGASFLYDRGNMVTGFVHKRLTEKTYTGGVSTRRISIKMMNYWIMESVLWIKWIGMVRPWLNLNIMKKKNRVGLLR